MTSEMQESNYVDKSYCQRSLSPQHHLKRERGQGERGSELGREFRMEGGRERENLGGREGEREGEREIKIKSVFIYTFTTRSIGYYIQIYILSDIR